MNAHTVIGDGGTKLHVQDAGKRAGKPIVFIHGFSQCSLAWSKQMNRTSPTRSVSWRWTSAAMDYQTSRAAPTESREPGRTTSRGHQQLKLEPTVIGRLVVRRRHHFRLCRSLRRGRDRRLELGRSRLPARRAARCGGFSTSDSSRSRRDSSPRTWTRAWCAAKPDSLVHS